RSDVTGVNVEVNQQAKIDVSLQVGEVTQTVEVAANASLVQTESTDVGTVIDNKRFVDLPLTLGGGIRNPSAFIYLSPAVAPGSVSAAHPEWVGLHAGRADGEPQGVQRQEQDLLVLFARPVLYSRRPIVRSEH